MSLPVDSLAKVQQLLTRHDAGEPVNTARGRDIYGASVVGAERDIRCNFRQLYLAEHFPVWRDDAHAPGSRGPDISGAVDLEPIRCLAHLRAGVPNEVALVRERSIGPHAVGAHI